MALFRFHRGTLEESLATTIIVKNTKDLLEKLADWWENAVTHGDRSFMYQWQIAIDKDEIFDKRCGWYTHRVYFQVRNSEFMAVGFLSEPLEEWEARSLR